MSRDHNLPWMDDSVLAELVAARIREGRYSDSFQEARGSDEPAEALVKIHGGIHRCRIGTVRITIVLDARVSPSSAQSEVPEH